MMTDSDIMTMRLSVQVFSCSVLEYTVSLTVPISKSHLSSQSTPLGALKATIYLR